MVDGLVSLPAFPQHQQGKFFSIALASSPTAADSKEQVCSVLTPLGLAHQHPHHQDQLSSFAQARRGAHCPSLIILMLLRPALPSVSGGKGALSLIRATTWQMTRTGSALLLSYPWGSATCTPTNRVSSTVLSGQGAGPILPRAAAGAGQDQLFHS